MNEFKPTESLIRRRINDNLLKVKNESSDVKSLLSLGLQTTKSYNDTVEINFHSSAFQDLNLCATFTSRKDLLRACILLATSRNTMAQENILEVIRIKLGKIKDKDYKYIAQLIHLKDPRIVDHVNDFLCYHLNGFVEMHKKYGNHYYGI